MATSTDDLYDRLTAIGEPEVAVVEWPRQDRARWRAREENEDVARYGTIPRSVWPPKVKGADLEERNYWITKLYGEERLTQREVAVQLRIHISTVQKEVIRLGIARGRNNYGIDSIKQRRVEQRRRLVVQMNGNGAGVEEIAEELGYHTSTIRNDLRALGLPPHPEGKTISPTVAAEIVENATRTLANVADVILDQSFDLSKATDEQLHEWERRLAQTGTAMRRIRAAMRSRKETQEEDHEHD